MKITKQNYKKNNYYPKITKAVYELLKTNNFVAPVDLFVKMGLLSKNDYESWRKGQVSYLERVIKCNLSKISSIMQIFSRHMRDRGCYESFTEYKTWGKGPKKDLRFSKSNSPNIERRYKIHFVDNNMKKKVKPKTTPADRNTNTIDEKRSFSTIPENNASHPQKTKG